MTERVPKLAPPATKPHVSVARLASYWYVACASSELRQAPISREILAIPMVLFRAEDGAAGALLDRCPHRNIPLSQGRVVGDHLQCGYHGWEFDGGGQCKVIPGLCGAAEGPARRVPHFATCEQDGYVWVYGTPDVTPDTRPFSVPGAVSDGYTTVRQQVEAEGTLHATVENALDVPHTAFLHAGLFRGAGKRHEIEAIIRRWDDTVEAQYVGEPCPRGLVGRFLAPGGGEVEHWDRFILPSIAQVEYRLANNHVLVTSMATPVSEFRTRMYASISMRTRPPAWLLKPVLLPIGKRIFGQDAVVLKAQTEVIQRFGGEQFVSTEIDILGGPIWNLMKRAERGEVGRGEDPEEIRRVRFMV